eukprot:11373801-Ditylum_brightwellii.AAC.1
MLAIKASHITWKKSVVALAPDSRVAAIVAVTFQAIAAFQATTNFQAEAALIFALAQMRAREVMAITMWMRPTWTLMMERDGKTKSQGQREEWQDKVECDQTNNDSGHESDWYSCTCIHSGEYKALKEAETNLKVQCSNTKHLKHSH